MSVGFGFAAPAGANAPLLQKAFVQRTPEAAQLYAQKQVKLFNWNNSEWKCLKFLWTKESNWNPNSYNKIPVYQIRNGKRVGLHAGGVPQVLNLDPKTPVKIQIEKGLEYIKNRYETPCSAWKHHLRKNWY